MSSVVLDPQTLEQLRRPGGRVEIRDPSGELVGYFTPHRGISAAGPTPPVEVPFTDEELDRFEKEPGGRTLAEILRDLENRS